MKRSVLWVAFVLACAGCPPIVNINTPLQKATNALDSAMMAITNQSELWRAELLQAASNLENNGMVKAGAFVRTTLLDGIARVGVEYRCDADFTASRLRDGLQQLKGALLDAGGDTAPTPTLRPAFVCNNTPTDIAWQEAPGSVAFRGYDFDADTLRAVVVEPAGGEVDISSSITWNNQYEVTIDLSGNGAGFPRPCQRVKLYSRDAYVGGVACTTKCPDPPPPTIIPADRRQSQNVADGCSGWSGCKYDEDYTKACSEGYSRETIEINRTGGKGSRHCGEGDQSPGSGRYNTRWLSDDVTDCSFHAHAGVTAGANHNVQCQWIVWEQRPEQRIEHPAPAVGWCR